MKKFSQYLEQRDTETKIDEIAWIMAQKGIDPIRYIYEYANAAAWIEQTNPPDSTGDTTGATQPGQMPSQMGVVKQMIGGMAKDNPPVAPSDATNIYTQAVQALKLLSDKLPEETKGLVTGIKAQLDAQGQQIVAALSQANKPQAQPQVTSKPVPAGSDTGVPPNTPPQAPPNAGAAIPTAPA